MPVPPTDPLLLELPEEFHSARLLLRVPRAGDGARLHEAIRSSLPELKAWMPWAADDYDLPKVEAWCRQAHGRFILREGLQYMLIEPATGLTLGMCGTARSIDFASRSIELGYWLRTDHVGRGLMTEAVRALRDMLVQAIRIQRVEIRCDAANFRSARVAERAGWALEATLRRDSMAVDGRLRNTCVYAWLAEDEAPDAATIRA